MKTEGAKLGDETRPTLVAKETLKSEEGLSGKVILNGIAQTDKPGLVVGVLADSQGLTTKGALIEESELAAKVALIDRSGPVSGVTQVGDPGLTVVEGVLTKELGLTVEEAVIEAPGLTDNIVLIGKTGLIAKVASSKAPGLADKAELMGESGLAAGAHIEDPLVAVEAELIDGSGLAVKVEMNDNSEHVIGVAQTDNLGLAVEVTQCGKTGLTVDAAMKEEARAVVEVETIRESGLAAKDGESVDTTELMAEVTIDGVGGDDGTTG